MEERTEAGALISQRPCKSRISKECFKHTLKVSSSLFLHGLNSKHFKTITAAIRISKHSCRPSRLVHDQRIFHSLSQFRETGAHRMSIPVKQNSVCNNAVYFTYKLQFSFRTLQCFFQEAAPCNSWSSPLKDAGLAFSGDVLYHLRKIGWKRFKMKGSSTQTDIVFY